MSRAALARFFAVREFTGLHMLVAMLAFFGVTIGVNLTMAILATNSWTGLIAKNGYVASIDYALDEAERKAAAELGWTVAVAEEKGRLTLKVRDQEGRAIPAEVTGQAARPLAEEAAISVDFAREGEGWRAQALLPAGRWIVKTTIAAAGGTVTWRSAHEVD